MRRYDEGRYGDDDYTLVRPALTPSQVAGVQSVLSDSPTEAILYPQIAADKNNFPLFNVILHLFTSDASRTITGFANVGVGIKVIMNVGSFDLVLAHNSGSSLAQNRIFAHTGANLTISAGRSALIIYDRINSVVRTIGL